MFRNLKRAVMVLVILVLAASTYAFAAANTVAPSNLGVGSDPVMGYAVSNIVYDLNQSVDPVTVYAISFRLTTLDVVSAVPAPPVFVSINTAAPAAVPVWSATAVCSNGIVADAAVPPLFWTVTCTMAVQPTVLGVLSLEVLASSSLNPAGP